MEENSKASHFIVPLFRKGDFGGVVYLVSNNIVNYVIVIATLSGVLGWPDNIVYGRVIPGMSIGLMAGCFYYAYMGYKLMKKEQRTDLAALPSGVSTTAMFVILYGVIMPLHYAIGDPEIAWSAAVAACFIGGFVEFLGGFVGKWIKAKLPRAALLGTVSGVAFIWMATQGVFDAFADPVIGLPVLIIGMLGLFGGYMFPGKVPPFVVAIVGGVIYAFALGRTSFDFTGIGFYFPNPENTVQGLINGFAYIVPYLTVVIPVEIYNFIETMDNVESANAAGDNYSVKEAQHVDGIFTMISALLGGVIPNTVWLGYPGLKQTGAGIGYSIISGIILGLAGIFGIFSLLISVMPPSVAAITYLWCAIVMVAQAFKECKVKHYAAIGVAMVPPVADFLFSQITGSIGATVGAWTQVLPSGLEGYSKEITNALMTNGVMWNGVAGVKAGSIVIGMILGAITAFIIDKRLDKVALVCAVGAVLSATGFIHSAQLGFYPTSPYAISYLIVGVICFILHKSNGKLIEDQDDFDYC